MADTDEQKGQKGKNTRIPQRRERADERAARRANLTPAEEAQREARRRDAAQTSVTIHGDLVPRPRDEQTSVNVEIATRPRDEQAMFARGELPKPKPEPEPEPVSTQDASAPRTAEPDAQAKALEALQACGGNWVAAAELMKQWCEQDVALYREVTRPALGSAVWKMIRSVAKRNGFAWKRGGWTSGGQ